MKKGVAPARKSFRRFFFFFLFRKIMTLESLLDSNCYPVAKMSHFPFRERIFGT